MPTGESLYGGGLSTGHHRRRQKPVIAPPQPGPVGHVPTPTPQIATSPAVEHHAAVQVIHHLVTGGLTHLPQPRTVGYAFGHLTDSEKATYGPLLLHRYVHFAGSPPEVLRGYEGKGPIGGAKPPAAPLRKTAPVAHQQPAQLFPAVSQLLAGDAKTPKQTAATAGAAAAEVGGVVSDFLHHSNFGAGKTPRPPKRNATHQGFSAAQPAPGIAKRQVRRQQRRFQRAFTPHTVRRGISTHEAGLIGDIALAAAPGGIGAGIRAGSRIAEAVRGGEAVASAGEKAAAAGRTARAASAVGRGARTAAESRVGRVALRGLRPAGKTARFGAKHPFLGATGADVAFNAPAAIRTGNPNALAQVPGAITGAASAVGHAVPGIAGNALQDIISLPASIPPSLYLTGKAGVEALAGNPKELKALGHQLETKDPVGALVTGHPSRALRNLAQHPVYGALELSGARSLIGAGAGRVFRTPRGEERPPSYVQGGARTGEGNAPLHGELGRVRGVYSRDPIMRAIQKRRDAAKLKARPGPVVEDVRGRPIRSIKATPREAKRVARQAAFTEFSTHRALQVAERDKIESVMHAVKPSGASAQVVQLMVQRVLRNPQTAAGDLAEFHQQLLEARPHLDSRSKLDANARSIAAVEAAMKNLDPHAVAVATDAFMLAQGPHEAQMVERGLLSEERSQRSHRFTFARTRMGAVHGKPADTSQRIAELEAQRATDGGPGLTIEQRSELQQLRAEPARLQKPNGQELTNAEIDAEAVRQGVPVDQHGTPRFGYVSNRPGGADRPGSFWRGYNERPTLAKHPLTGAAASQGLSELSWENLIGSLQHQATTVGATKAFDRLGARFGLGVRDANGVMRPFGPIGRKAAPQVAREAIDNPADYNLELPPIRGGYTVFQTGALTATARELEAARRFGATGAAEAPSPHPELGHDKLMEAAVTRGLEAADPKGKTYIIPVAIADLLRENFAPRAAFWRAAEGATGWLKRSWLPTSPSWALGNIVDNYLTRTFGTGLGIGDIRTGTKLGRIVLREHGAEGPRNLETMVPGALYAQVSRQARHLPAEFRGDPILEDIARLGGAVARTRPARIALNAFNKYAGAVYHYEGKYVEQLPQYAELSRSSRQLLGMTRGQFRRAVKAEAPAVMDFVNHGLRDTKYQQHFAEEVAKTYGNWTRMSPSARRFFSTIAPFWTWARAATRFVFVTMPHDHPAITAILAAASSMTRAERAKAGLDQKAPIPVPGWLQGSVPLGGGGAAKLSNLTSYGFFADPIGSYSQMFFPQGQAVIYNLQGLDWTGKQLTQADGRPATEQQRAQAAILTFAEQFIPGATQATAVAKHGPSGLSPVKVYPKSYLDYLRNQQNQQEIHVPIKGVPQLGGGGGSSSESSGGWGGGSSSSSGGW